MELSSLPGLGRANLCNCRHFQAKGKEGPLMCLKCVTVMKKWSVRGKSIARGWIEEPNYRLKAARYPQINVHMLACAHDTWQSAKSLNFHETNSSVFGLPARVCNAPNCIFIEGAYLSDLTSYVNLQCIRTTALMTCFFLRSGLPWVKGCFGDSYIKFNDFSYLQSFK